MLAFILTLFFSVYQNVPPSPSSMQRSFFTDICVVSLHLWTLEKNLCDRIFLWFSLAMISQFLQPVSTWLFIPCAHTMCFVLCIHTITWNSFAIYILSLSRSAFFLAFLRSLNLYFSNTSTFLCNVFQWSQHATVDCNECIHTTMVLCFYSALVSKTYHWNDIQRMLDMRKYLQHLQILFENCTKRKCGRLETLRNKKNHVKYLV